MRERRFPGSTSGPGGLREARLRGKLAISFRSRGAILRPAAGVTPLESPTKHTVADREAASQICPFGSGEPETTGAPLSIRRRLKKERICGVSHGNPIRLATIRVDNARGPRRLTGRFLLRAAPGSLRTSLASWRSGRGERPSSRCAFAGGIGVRRRGKPCPS